MNWDFSLLKTASDPVLSVFTSTVAVPSATDYPGCTLVQDDNGSYTYIKSVSTPTTRTELLGLTLQGSVVNLTNSAIAEWLHLYNPKTKVSVDKRFLVNLVSDSPLILVWVSIYYLWHYIELGTKTEFQKIKLESLVKEMELNCPLCQGQANADDDSIKNVINKLF